ncbi:LytR/AlgR family response regulator transcription factor [Saccharicrinis sp. FJH54]|uniref:LytR/AlgR family response regulator transcription factor n=1 Tax=Saccharicrinis sp. FJH54 TaxID=3344665 RepID=UPI0035D455AC
MKKIRALLVDDEHDAIDVMDNLLSDIDYIDVIDRISNPLKVECNVSKFQPDVVFLDINMPGINGIQLLENIREYNTEVYVVIVSAHRSYISDAILHNVFAFLLKPVNRHQLKDITDRILDIKKEVEIRDYKGMIKLPVNDGYVYINTNDILFLEAEGNYSRITLINNQAYISSYNMGRLHKKLPQSDFYRINRSCVMNKHYLFKIDKAKKNCVARIGDNEIQKEISGVFMTTFNKILQ